MQSIFIVIASVCSFLLVQVFTNYYHGLPQYDGVNSLGMILPMSLIMGLITSSFSKVTYDYLSHLTKGIERVAKGDFNVLLDTQKAGPLTEVFHNFNRMVKELNSVQTLREDFVNNFSHEFKTPITSINGFANLLLDTEVSEEEKAQYLKIIADESARLADLSSTTLLMSKLDSQQFVIDRSPYSLDEQLKQCAILLSPEWNKKNIELSVDVIPVTYTGNQELLQHVWINLLSNAIKFTPEYGEISIEMKSINDIASISISDTGIGIDDNALPFIFDKHYQADISRTVKGLGLGLSIVKRIVELCEGTITAQSSPQEGSTFIVTLPLY